MSLKLNLVNSEFVNSAGMRLSDFLIWHDHIFEAAKKSSTRLGFRRRATHYLDADNTRIWAGAAPASKMFVDKNSKRGY